MTARERFEQKLKHLTIDEITSVPCPFCGGKLDFMGMPDEIYESDGTFTRHETVVCRTCEMRIEVAQKYTPTKLFVKEYDDTFAEEWLDEHICEVADALNDSEIDVKEVEV